MVLWLYLFWTNLFSFVIFSCVEFRLDRYILSPKWLYNNSKVNKFGVVLYFILLSLIIPEYYLLMFLYWVTHVGRKV